MTRSAVSAKNVVLCAMLLVLPAAVLSGARADYDNTPIVVFRVDDGRANWRNRYAGLGGMSALAYGKLKQIPITWAVVTDWAVNKPGYYPPPLTWAELTDYVNTAGGEIASHSVRHLAETSQARYIEEITQSKAEIEAHLPGYTCRTFIQPGVWTGEAYLDQFAELDQPIAQAIQQTYAQSQAYLGWTWVVGGIYYRYGMTRNICLDYTAAPSADAVRATLDVVAATPGCIFEFVMHGVQETGGTKSGEARADVLKAVMDYLAQLRDAGKIRLMTVDQAYSAALDPSLNRLADGGLEVVRPGPDNPIGPVTLEGNASIVPDGGIDNSRCALLPSGRTNKLRWKAYVPPGRYRLSWWQKHVASSGPPRSVTVHVTASGAGRPTAYAINYKPVSSSSLNTWEQRFLYMLVTYGNPDCGVLFQTDPDRTFKIDGASLTLEPLDPSTAPTGTTAVPVCGQYTISWNTPPDPQVTSIKLRYNDRACPIAPDQDTALASVQAVPGTRQSVNVSLSGTSTGWYYVSVFAIKGDGSFTGPDLAVVKVDTSPPETPQINPTFLPNGDIYACWSSADPESGICLYRYGVGSSCGGPANVLNWTTTTDNCATLTGLPIGEELYLMVQAKNNADKWSSTGCEGLGGLASVFKFPDGTRVTVSGIVSAVFGDCFYVQSPKRERGIRVINSAAPFAEGSVARVRGTLTTVNGERAVIPDP